MSGLSRRGFLAAAVSSTVLAGCTDTAADTAPVVSGSRTAQPTPTPRRTAQRRLPVGVHANKLGLIPVLMHHRLVASNPGSYDMTPAFFRAELDRLYRENYHPVRAIDLVSRNLDSVPPGKTPVVLTFDDGTPGQVAFDANGQVAADCALGILRAFHARHPDFPAVATFYVNKNPFGLTGAAAIQALVRLNELGCEVGNHTWNHPNLHTLTRAQAEAEIGSLAAMVSRALPAAPPRTLALPFGAHPRDPGVLARGGAGGTAYRNLGVLLVGAEPSHSPFHPGFDPMAIPRIRCSSRDGELEFSYWLDRLARRSGLKFIAGSN
ncbi:polysaccharide deacetylase family protein [Kribbella monticola]|uniref:polysaccharide deacetylase family protein n=1 Tax=Kribbella monticola TaxID=2185285 RepID=UPI000DD43D9A|nr:polysaccharide deacetylase family protein [Kribbella monticola]